MDLMEDREAVEADKYLVDSAEEHELFANMGYFPEGLPIEYPATKNEKRRLLF